MRLYRAGVGRCPGPGDVQGSRGVSAGAGGLSLFARACGAVPHHRTRLDCKGAPMTVFDTHALRIARQTIRMTPAMRAVMGGPTLAEARATVKRLGSAAEHAAIRS